MIVRRILLLGSMVLLSACKEERLLLHFEQSVASGWSVEPVYKQAILEGLDAAGVDSSQAALSVRDNGLVVAVSFPDNALDQGQQERLAAYFDDLLKARTEAEKVRLRIKHEEPKQTEDNALSDVARMLQEKARKMRWLFTSRIKHFDEPRLTYQQQKQKGLRLYESSPARCQVTFGLESPLPHIDYQLSLPGDNASASMVNRFLGLQSFRLPSSISIGASDLDQAVADGHYEYELVTSRYAETKRADELVFFFGELGEVLHSGGATTTDLHTFESDCLERITGAGRPFTFHYGSSLDRVVAVNYLFGEQAR